jgi:hypothetical protein
MVVFISEDDCVAIATCYTVLLFCRKFIHPGWLRKKHGVTFFFKVFRYLHHPAIEVRVVDHVMISFPISRYYCLL